MSFISEFDAVPASRPSLVPNRFDTFFDLYGLSLKQEAGLQQRTITLIARSPASAPARALAMNLARFQPLSVEVNIIFAQIAPADALEFTVRSLAPVCRHAPEAIIRWAKNRALLDAHERLTLGRTLCWTGDSMRRSEDARGGIDQVEDGTLATLAAANASFAYLWRASKPLPKTLFSRTGAFNADHSPAFAAGEASLTVQENIERLEDYLRIRCH